MKKSNIVILLSYILILCSCYGSQKNTKQKDFVSKYGYDDYSIFEGVTLFHRGVQDSLILMAGLTPERQGTRDNINGTAIHYNPQDSVISKLERSNNAQIDTIYVNKLAKRFYELGIYQICVDFDGTVRIQIDDNSGSDVVRFTNDSIRKKCSKECQWKKISGNWYVPIFQQ